MSHLSWRRMRPRSRFAAYVEPWTVVGRPLIDMPLFLEPDIYINVPLEATYMAAYRGVPNRWNACSKRAHDGRC